MFLVASSAGGSRPSVSLRDGGAAQADRAVHRLRSAGRRRVRGGPAAGWNAFASVRVRNSRKSDAKNSVWRFDLNRFGTGTHGLLPICECICFDFEVREECCKRGRLLMARAYGDFQNAAKSWVNVSRRHQGLDLRSTHELARGKNAGDILLVIDAMEALVTRSKVDECQI